MMPCFFSLCVLLNFFFLSRGPPGACFFLSRKKHMCDLHVMKKYLSSSGGAPAGQKNLVFGCGKAKCVQWWPSWRGGRIECCRAGCDTIDQDPERDPTFLVEFGPGVRIPVPDKYYDVVLMEGMHFCLPAIREIYRVARDPKPRPHQYLETRHVLDLL